MPNVASVLKAEIARVSKKESKSLFGPLLATVSSLKKSVSSLKKRVASLEAKSERLEKKLGGGSAIAIPAPEKVGKSRVGAGNIAKLRAKLDLTRAEMAALIDVNANSIFLWERGKAKPRAAAKAKIIALRGLGKRQIKKMLAKLAPAPEAKAAPAQDSSAS